MKNYFKPNSKIAIKIALAIKSITAGLAGYEYFSGNPKYAVWIGAIGLVCNEVVNILSDGTKKDNA